jgi:hypothetical protein
MLFLISTEFWSDIKEFQHISLYLYAINIDHHEFFTWLNINKTSKDQMLKIEGVYHFDLGVIPYGVDTTWSSTWSHYDTITIFPLCWTTYGSSSCVYWSKRIEGFVVLIRSLQASSFYLVPNPLQF